MTPIDSLATLSDTELFEKVQRLTARSNVTLADLLVHLGEVEARGLHRTRACASLYTYCVYELRMSEDAAYRRSKAARLVREHPELRDAIAKGEIHLTGVLMIGPLLGGERHAEILERARFRNKRELSRLVAEMDPRPEVPARIEPLGPALVPRPPTHEGHLSALAGPMRHLPPGQRPEDWIDGATEEEPTAAAVEGESGGDTAEGESGGDTEATGRADDTAAARPPRPLHYKVQFTASQEHVDLLNEVGDLLGHERPRPSVPEIHLRALRALVRELRAKKRAAPARVGASAQGEKALGAAPARVGASAWGDHGSGGRRTSSRYVPAAVRRAVWARDGARCACVDERGVRCRETCGLELHHRDAFALGGPPTVANLELRCRAHNGLAAEEDFGREQMEWMRGRGHGPAPARGGPGP